MNNLKKGAILIYTKDGSKWEFIEYGENEFSTVVDDEDNRDYTGSSITNKDVVCVRHLGSSTEPQKMNASEFRIE